MGSTPTQEPITPANPNGKIRLDHRSFSKEENTEHKETSPHEEKKSEK
jgi:hypothetical protein